MYRIVDRDGDGEAREIAKYDSAYVALEAMRSAVLEDGPGSAGLRLVDPTGQVLVEAADVLEMTPAMG